MNPEHPIVLSVLLPLLGCATPGNESEHSSVSVSAGPTAGAARGDALVVSHETYTLPNGMTVTLHEDHSLPRVVIDTWFAVGSKDEAPGRTGFAHLFEHLMFMGTGRVPGNEFDVLMERGGGSNNASTSSDRTNYYSMGPSSLLPTLLWLDADRLEALADHMTQEKLDRQREVVRNERRQTTENVPYGKGSLLVPEALYPVGHPYHHPVIGSHEDLEAATLEDVVAFFHTFYVPANASLVVAGDFDPEAVKEIVERTFGAIPAKDLPEHRTAPAWNELVLAREKRIVTTDQVQFPLLTLAWHSPALYRPGDAELDLVGAILAGGPSSRLEKRLVQELGLAQSVSAYQRSSELSSAFEIEALAAPGADLEEIKRVVLAELATFCTDGPDESELERAKVRQESDFLRRMEGLLARADSINAYRHYFGVSDGFQRDLDRWLDATRAGLRDWARAVFVPGRVDLRILPEGAAIDGASLDERPKDFPAAQFTPPVVESHSLSNGIPVHVVERPGTRLFSGALVAAGGESLTPSELAGLAPLTAAMLDAGAGGLDRAAFADAVDAIGASIRTEASVRSTLISLSGLTSRLEETLDRFADVVHRPNLTVEDFELERALALAAIEARADDPNAVARSVGNALLFGRDDVRGRPLIGTEESVSRTSLDDVRAAWTRVLATTSSAFVFVGDFGTEGPSALLAALEHRFGSWERVAPVVPELTPLVEPAPGRIVLVDRPGAPQTVIQVLRPLPALEGPEREARACTDTVFGGTFTSRLNGNLREDKGYTYGARSRVLQAGEQWLLIATSSVRTDVTGASLTEFRREFDAMAASGIDEHELSKAVETLRGRLIGQSETTDGLGESLAALLENRRPLDDARRSLTALDGITVADANAIACGGLYRWDDLLVVLVGDASTVVPQLEEAGFPAPTMVDEDGGVVGP